MFSTKKSMSPKSAHVMNRDLDLNRCLICGELESRLVLTDYPDGTRLCLEGGFAEGIFGICKGQAKEYVISTAGKTVITRIVNPGGVIGLEAVMGGGIYLTTVETIGPTTAYFISRRDLLGSMRSYPAVRLAVTTQLSEQCRHAYNEIRKCGLGVPARMARFLLEQSLESPTRRAKLGKTHINLTREEIGEAVGASRETVSRIVAFWLRKRWIRITGAVWRIQDRTRLVMLATKAGIAAQVRAPRLP